MATHEKRGDSYKITVSLGYDMNGKQIRKRTTWTPEPGMTPRQIEKELERQKVLFEEKCLNGQVLDGNIKFAEFAEIWFCDYAKKQLKAKTISRYRDLMKRILPAIGHLRLSRIQPHHLLAFYANLEESGVRNDQKYQCAVDFKKLLKKLKLTKASLMTVAGVSISVLDSVTGGKNISQASAQKIAKALDTPLTDLFKAVEGRENLSAKTIRHHHGLISSILSTAVQWQLLLSNPCDRVKAPKVGRSQPKYLDDVQARELIESLRGEPHQYQVVVKLLVYTGLRRGELCGLEWTDIDFAQSVIHIRRESLYLPEKGIFVEDGKTGSSIRSIKAPFTAMKLLEEHRIWQEKDKMKKGNRWQESNRLFTAWSGKPIHPDTITNWFHKFVHKQGLPDINIHSLRHTNATLMIAAGTAVTTVAKRLGHANASTTTKIYAHAIRSADEAAAETLQDILNPIAVANAEKE